LGSIFNISAYTKPLPRIAGALALSAVVLGMFSCGKFGSKKSDSEEPAVARVHDTYLYLSEVKEMIPANTGKEDSILLVRNFIENWIKRQVILHKAESNLDDEKKDVEQRLQEYRNSLITYIYESELIEQRLDTTVTDEEIEQYYQENQRNFELKDNIVKVLYFKVKKNAPKIAKVRGWYRSQNTRDRALLEDYCFQFASDFHLDDETWLPFDEVMKKVPIKTYDKESFLRNNRFVETEDSTYYYFVRFSDMQIRESISPLSFVRDDIRNLILNKRKLELIREMEQAVYNEALKKNEIEIYMQ
jgi:hypothetical protein